MSPVTRATTGDAGVAFKLLYTDRERGTFTTLVRMDAGASIPAHRHLGVEQCLVIDGDLAIGDKATAEQLARTWMSEPDDVLAKALEQSARRR